MATPTAKIIVLLKEEKKKQSFCVSVFGDTSHLELIDLDYSKW